MLVEPLRSKAGADGVLFPVRPAEGRERELARGKSRFGLLVSAGLRPNHVVFDLAARSIGSAHFIISYLTPGAYFGRLPLTASCTRTEPILAVKLPVILSPTDRAFIPPRPVNFALLDLTTHAANLRGELERLRHAMAMDGLLYLSAPGAAARACERAEVDSAARSTGWHAQYAGRCAHDTDEWYVELEVR